MDEPRMITAIAGFFGAIVGAIGSFFGLKYRVDRMEKDFDSHKKIAITAPSCDKCLAGTTSRLSTLERFMADIHKKQDQTIAKLNQIIGKLQ
ncbi:MAG: hypothetical protein GXP46_01890 [Deferribacteres bacterium]|nr:hypothetical protein [Deferribacteres bacterium]